MMRKQVFAVTIGVLLVLSVFSVLQFWQIKPAQATDLFTSGFEEGQLNPAPGVWSKNASGNIVTSPVHAGTYAASLAISGADRYIFKTMSNNELWTRFYWNCTALPSANNDEVLVWDFRYQTSGYSYLALKLANVSNVLNWRISARNDSAWVDNDTTTNVPVINTWYYLELYLKAGSGTGAADFWVNGIETLKFNELTNDDRGVITDVGPCAIITAGSPSATFYYDDVVFADAYIGPIPTDDPSGVATDWTYRIYKNATAVYMFDDTGTSVYSASNLSASENVFNFAIGNCSGGGSVYVIPATYNTTAPIGSSGSFSGDNIWLQFGPDTLVQRTSGSGEGDYLLQFRNFGSSITNLTITSNGTAYFNSSGFGDGLAFRIGLNSTFSNLYFSHMASAATSLTRLRYCNFYNLTFYSWDELYYGQTAFGGNDIQYSNFDNVTIDGANQAKTRVGFYLGDWEDYTGWNGSYFNTIQRMWIKNLRRDGIYLNSGAAGWHVYNNTFSNCTVENNWESGYDAIKLRPAQNNTFTGIVIKNFTDAVTTGTSYDSGEVDGNCTGNSVTATISGTTVTSLILTSDGNNQSVDNNFFNLTVSNGKGTYFAQGTNSPIHDNTVYMNFTDCSAGIYLEQGNISSNTFYLNFTRCGTGGHSDIWHYSGWTNITSNTFNIYATSGNPNGLYDFVNGTQGNVVIYPYSYSGPPPVLVTITVTSPTNTTYSSSSITVTLSATVSGSTLDKIWWNCKNGTNWIYANNQTYTTSTSMTGIYSGSQYTFYAFANATDGTSNYLTVMFSESIVSGTVTVTITSPTSGIVYVVTTIPIQFSATSTAGTIDRQWWNILVVSSSTWLTSYNITYSGVTSVNNLANGEYTLYAYANDTSNNVGCKTETITVNVPSQGGGGGGGGGGGTQNLPNNNNPAQTQQPSSNNTNVQAAIVNWDWRHLSPAQGLLILGVIAFCGYILVNQTTSKNKRKPKWSKPSFWA